MIVIEGIIGAGKSTLAHELRKRIPRSVLYEEPVDANPYLPLFYREPAKYALEMQFFLMSYRYRMHMEAVEKEWREGLVSIFDRSIYGDAAFAYLLHRSGDIGDLGYRNYLRHREMMERTLLVPHHVVYLDVEIETAQKRVRVRGRECETGIPDSYQEALRAAYEEKVLAPLRQKTRVSVVDWNSELAEERMASILDLLGPQMTHGGLPCG